MYNKKVWQDEVVEYSKRYQLDAVSAGIYDLTRITGDIISQDPVNALNLNNMEGGIYQNSLVNSQQSLEIAKLYMELDLAKLSGVGF